MIPQTQPRAPRNSSKINLLISLGFHAVAVLALGYFAAREGLLGKQLRKIAVEMVKEVQPEKPKEPEKPRTEIPPIASTPKTDPVPSAAPRDQPVAPSPAGGNLAAPPAVAPPPLDVPAFVFEGGQAVESTSDPIQLYKGFVEYAFRSRWNRPVDVPDASFVAEIEVAIDRAGRVSGSDWKRRSGHERWDASVRAAIAQTTALNRPPPTNFPSRVLVRFDVQEVQETLSP
jgi:outer membrane biosynthesis protein TonB